MKSEQLMITQIITPSHAFEILLAGALWVSFWADEPCLFIRYIYISNGAFQLKDHKLND